MLLRLFAIILLGAAMTGCSMLKPVPVEQTSVYLIQTGAVKVAKARPTHKTLLVTKPRAAAGFDSNKMAYRLKPYQIAHYTKNRWADEPSEMLTPLMVQALQDSHRFHGVVSTPFSGKADLRLSTELEFLIQNYMFKPSRIELQIRARLVDDKTTQVIAVKQFNYTKEAPFGTPYGGVIATNHVVETFLQDLTRFVVVHS